MSDSSWACPTFHGKYHTYGKEFQIQAFLDGDSLNLIEVGDGHVRNQIDKELSETFGHNSSRRQIYLPLLDEIIAVQDDKTKMWHRGQVKNIYHSNEHVFIVLLIDYGIHIRVTEENARALPQTAMCRRPPTYIKFKVFGVLPRSYELKVNRTLYLEPGIVDNFDESLLLFYKDVVDATSKLYISTEHHKHYIVQDAIIADLHFQSKGRCFSLIEQLCALEYAYYDEKGFKEKYGLPNFDSCESSCCKQSVDHDTFVAQVKETIFPVPTIPYFESVEPLGLPSLPPKKKKKKKKNRNSILLSGRDLTTDFVINPEYAREAEMRAYGRLIPSPTAEEHKANAEFWAKVKKECAPELDEEFERSQSHRKPVYFPAGMNLNTAWQRREIMRKVQYGTDDEIKTSRHEHSTFTKPGGISKNTLCPDLEQKFEGLNLSGNSPEQSNCGSQFVEEEEIENW